MPLPTDAAATMPKSSPNSLGTINESIESASIYGIYTYLLIDFKKAARILGKRHLRIMMPPPRINLSVLTVR